MHKMRLVSPGVLGVKKYFSRSDYSRASATLAESYGNSLDVGRSVDHQRLFRRRRKLAGSLLGRLSDQGRRAK